MILASSACSVLFSTLFIARASFIIDGHRYFTLFDDAMVSMRYARNLAAGEGLRWNPGEPPVEGYTNLLWTLWMAFLHLLRLPDRITPLVVSASGAALIVATVFMAARLARRLAPDDSSRVAAIAAAATALCYPLIFWTLRGMEVGLLAFLIVAGADFAVSVASEADGDRHVGRLTVVLVLLTLVRPDGIVPALVIGACAAWTRPARERLGAAIRLCGIPLGVLGAHEVVRWGYYRDLMPNTYYLKMTGVPATVRVGRGVATVGPTALKMLLVPLLIAAATSRRLYRSAAGALLLLVPAALLAYAVYVGGDAWEWMPVTDRYLTPALPLLLTGVAVALAGRQIAMQVIGCVVVVAAMSAPGAIDWVKTGGSHVGDDAEMAWMGVRVRQTTSESTSIGVVWAGAVPYFSHRPAVDFLGKNDRVIARRPPLLPFFPGHDRFDYAYSIGVLRPDLILQLWFPTRQLLDELPRLGYENVFGGVFAKRGSSVDVQRLREAFNEVSPK